MFRLIFSISAIDSKKLPNASEIMQAMLQWTYQNAVYSTTKAAVYPTGLVKSIGNLSFEKEIRNNNETCLDHFKLERPWVDFGFRNLRLTKLEMAILKHHFPTCLWQHSRSNWWQTWATSMPVTKHLQPKNIWFRSISRSIDWFHYTLHLNPDGLTLKF